MVCFLILSVSLSASRSPNNAEITKRVENLNTVIDLKVTDEVTDQINYYIERRRSTSETILGRTSLYFPLIENVLRDKNLPDELKYVAVIESSLLPDIESHKGAAGIWQFMKGTAEMYGLKIDKHVDERKDFVKSTNTALDYLKVLYDIYGNWTLALAAYNCGSGNLNKAIKKAGGSTDYWEVQKYLPKETQKYIPRFIAAAYLMNYYYLHDLVPTEPSDDMKYVASVQAFDKIDLKKISEEFDVDYDIIKSLNAMYRKGFIPASKEGEYLLTLPEQKMYAYVDKYNSYEYLTYRPSYRANDVKTTEDLILETRAKTQINRLQRNPKRSFAIRDNLKNNAFLYDLAIDMSYVSSENKTYTLKKKESLSDVADANNMKLSDLLAINNFTENNGPKPGSLIKLAR